MPPALTVTPTIPPVGPPSIFADIFREVGQWIVGQWPSFVHFGKDALGFLVGVSIPLSAALIIAIIYCVEQLKRIRRKEAEIHGELHVEPAYEAVPAATGGDHALAHQWEKVTAHIGSPNQNDWKQAIMEADVLLDDILNKMGYRGESVGEKLKRVESGDMKSLNDAWEAHKVRNQIAHEGSSFVLDQHHAKQVISMYRRVFEEFFYI